jgi:hypothetical protein
VAPDLILDAWGHGNAVVRTTVGCDGLDAAGGENIPMQDRPREYVAAVRQATSVSSKIVIANCLPMGSRSWCIGLTAPGEAANQVGVASMCPFQP